ncbi:hypothetical protein [Alienimonas sp. DA493]|uniref:hypothetical protein n=1 Tax=Alienimonas sp. DA493 TaxID=3373605 RepID=UPI003753FB43
MRRPLHCVPLFAACLGLGVLSLAGCGDSDAGSNAASVELSAEEIEAMEAAGAEEEQYE